ncbi:ornithine cyclodeaminase family protein [Actinoplanes sp. NPDC020271]|uniref:ornithine cyclodeaminase family protein n=1 Tax=Actinoplanes sp. NPDC020271 TaxID=3363896 RepID=UPI0037AE745B
MTMLVIDAAAVAELLTPRRALGAVEEAFRALERDAVVQPQRIVMGHGRGRALAAMPAMVETHGLGAKLVTITPENIEAGRPAHTILILLFNEADGTPLALLDGSRITALRTAAASALATAALARPEAETLAILGAGVQARAHVECLREVRPIRRVRVWSRRRASAEALAADVRAGTTLDVVVVDNPDKAAAEADIVCTTTASTTPVLSLDGVRPGVHVNAIGASFASLCELTPEAVAAAAVYVDSLAAARREAGDLLNATEHGVFGFDAVRGELGGLLTGRCPGRASEDEITLFKSVGLAAQDITVGAFVAAAAREAGHGTDVALGRHP